MWPVVVELFQCWCPIRGREVGHEGTVWPKPDMYTSSSRKPGEISVSAAIGGVAKVVNASSELKTSVFGLNFLQDKTGNALLVCWWGQSFLSNGFVVAKDTGESETARPSFALSLLEYAAVSELFVLQGSPDFIVFYFRVLPIGIIHGRSKRRYRSIH